MSHSFFIAFLKRYSFGENLIIDLIKTLLTNQESCVINGSYAAKYFELERGARQGNPTWTYLFILVLEIIFVIVKANKNIHGLNIFDHEYLYNAYADHRALFLKDIHSLKKLFKTPEFIFRILWTCLIITQESVSQKVLHWHFV